MSGPEPWPVLCSTSVNVPVFFLCTVTMPGPEEPWPVGYMFHFRSLVPAPVQLGEHSLYVPFLFQFLFSSCVTMPGPEPWPVGYMPHFRSLVPAQVQLGEVYIPARRPVRDWNYLRVPEPFTCSEGVIICHNGHS